jgi:ribosome-binding ATPase YchF (GTP1/OBG family)
MKLSIGIVGLPNVGKSTLFKILTKQEVNTANYPFATIDPNVGIVPVPDERLAALSNLIRPKKTIPAVVEFLDIAGLVKGANKGEGLGNQFLAHIRETQTVVVVVRTFKNPEIIHVESSVDPIRDLETVNAELAFKDLETIEKRLEKLEGEARSGDKQAGKSLAVLNAVRKELNGGNLILKYKEEEIVKELSLLTAKRQIYLLNGSPQDAPEELIERIRAVGGDYIIADLAKEEELPILIKKAYAILDLISFFSILSDEVRAWTAKRGTKAPQAVGTIHTDFEKNFIRAEIINWQKLLEAAHSMGSINSPQASSGQAAWNQARQKGLIRLEGKDYIVQDGDVIMVRHG